MYVAWDVASLQVPGLVVKAYLKTKFRDVQQDFVSVFMATLKVLK